MNVAKIVEHDAGRVDVRNLRSHFVTELGKPISQERFGQLLGVSWRTVARWEAGGQPDLQMIRKLRRVGHVLDFLDDMVEATDRLRFFEEEHPSLLIRPIDCLSSEAGTRAVISLLESVETGAFS